jgi:hypothetical protein
MLGAKIRAVITVCPVAIEHRKKGAVFIASELGFDAEVVLVRLVRGCR